MKGVSDLLLSFEGKDAYRTAQVLGKVLYEQVKPLDQRVQVSDKTYLGVGYEVACKNFEGEDILRNAIKVRVADWEGSGVSIKEIVPVAEGFYVLSSLLRKVGNIDLTDKIGGLTLIKQNGEFYVAYGSKVLTFDDEDRLKLAFAIDKGIYVKGEGYLVRDGGKTEILGTLVADPVKLSIFLRAGYG